MTQRIKGQEVGLAWTTPTGEPQGLDNILSAEATLDIEILEEAYLGENVNQFDELFKGVSGQAELHLDDVGYFEFTAQVQDRAQRRTSAGGIFNLTMSFAFPSGRRARITFEDLKFGELPIRAPARGEYVTATVSWKCSTLRRVL